MTHHIASQHSTAPALQHTILYHIIPFSILSPSFVFRVFGRFGYGFGLPKDSPYTDQFSVKILELRQKGFLQLLQNTWLKGICDKITQQDGRHYLEVSVKLGGIYSCFIVCMCVYICVCVCMCVCMCMCV